MLDFIIFCLAIVGLTFIIVDSSIVAPFRYFCEKHLPSKISELLNCYQCTGFWAGLFLSIGFLDYFNFFGYFVYALVGSFLSLFIGNVVDYLQAQTLVSLEDE